MPIPAMDERGLLPGGYHSADFREIEQRFVYGPYRENLYRQVRTFVDQELRGVAAGLRLVLGGSYFSDKEEPADIECTVYLPPEQIAARLELVQLQGGIQHDRIKRTYRADFYISIEMEGFNDFGAFFQYVGPKTAHTKGLDEKDARGVIEVVAWELG